MRLSLYHFARPARHRSITSQLRPPNTSSAAKQARQLYSTRRRAAGSSRRPSRKIPSGSKGLAVSVGAGLLLTATAFLAAGTGTGTGAMSSKLIPSNPSDVMVIRDVTPNITTLSVPFSRLGRMKIGGRATVVRLTSGGLAVFSPVALTPDVRAKLASLGGDVRYIVALDTKHHLFISEWTQAFPSARIVGPAGLPEKRRRSTDPRVGDEPFAAVLDASSPSSKRQACVGDDFDVDLECEVVATYVDKELVFFYRPDRVLIQADLLFNLPPTEQYSRVPETERKPGLLEKFIYSFLTTSGDAKGAKRFIWHVLSRGDRARFGESVRRIGGWGFVTIIPCHGDCIEGNGKEVFRKMFAWHLEGA